MSGIRSSLIERGHQQTKGKRSSKEQMSGFVETVCRNNHTDSKSQPSQLFISHIIVPDILGRGGDLWGCLGGLVFLMLGEFFPFLQVGTLADQIS